MTFADPQATNQTSTVNPGGLGSGANLTQAPSANFVAGGVGLAQTTQLSDYKIIRRNGSVVAFEPSKIAIAVTKAFLAVNGGQGAASARIREQVEQLTQNVVRALLRSRPNGGTFHIEDIQDQVELALMRSGEHNVARAYVLYREKRNQERAAQQSLNQEQSADASLPTVQVTTQCGSFAKRN
jgi:ribonucleoside-diphosphate reductase alpha chain